MILILNVSLVTAFAEASILSHFCCFQKKKIYEKSLCIYLCNVWIVTDNKYDFVYTQPRELKILNYTVRLRVSLMMMNNNVTYAYT